MKAEHRCPLLADPGTTWEGLTEADIVDCVQATFEAWSCATWREWPYPRGTSAKLDLLATDLTTPAKPKTWAIEVKCLWAGEDKHLTGADRPPAEALLKDFHNLASILGKVAASPLVVWAVFSDKGDTTPLDGTRKALEATVPWRVADQASADLRSSRAVGPRSRWRHIHVVVFRPR